MAQQLTIQELQKLRADIEQRNAEIKFIRSKKEFRIQQYNALIKGIQKEISELDAELRSNHNAYFNAGTQLEELTGQKRLATKT